jgi:hypothetical protein
MRTREVATTAPETSFIAAVAAACRSSPLSSM